LNFGFELKIHKFEFLAPHDELQTQTNKKGPMNTSHLQTTFLISEVVIKSKVSNTTGHAPCNDQF
jgi:hypothetical protein